MRARRDTAIENASLMDNWDDAEGYYSEWPRQCFVSLAFTASLDCGVCVSLCAPVGLNCVTYINDWTNQGTIWHMGSGVLKQPCIG